MVLGAAHGLDAFPVLGAHLIDVVGDVGRADEADGVDVGVGQDGVDRHLVAVDDVQHALGRAGLHHQFAQTHRQRRIALGRLQDEGVAGGDRHAEHPHRDHAGEVERGDARHDAERLAHGIDVDAGAGALRVFALQRVRDAAGEFNDFQTALDVALGVGDDLAVFRGQQLGQLVHVGLDQALELEHDAGAALRVGAGPALEGGLSGLNRAVHLADGRQLDAGLNLAGVGVEHVAETARCAVEGRTVDEVANVAHGGVSLCVVVFVSSWPSRRTPRHPLQFCILCCAFLQCSTGTTFASSSPPRGRARWLWRPSVWA
ncbi:hypothetical protein D3C81_1192440 [compost metagenome]